MALRGLGKKFHILSLPGDISPAASRFLRHTSITICLSLPVAMCSTLYNPNIGTNLMRKATQRPRYKTFVQGTWCQCFSQRYSTISMSRFYRMLIDGIGLIYHALKFHMDSRPWPTLGCGFLYDSFHSILIKEEYWERHGLFASGKSVHLQRRCPHLSLNFTVNMPIRDQHSKKNSWHSFSEPLKLTENHIVETQPL